MSLERRGDTENEREERTSGRSSGDIMSAVGVAEKLAEKERTWSSLRRLERRGEPVSGAAPQYQPRGGFIKQDGT